MIKTLRPRIESGEVVYGTWLNLGSSLTAEICARAGFDWVVIDMEHGTGDFRELLHQLQAIEATPTVPLVRVAFNEPWLIKRTLDIGPSGLVIPLIASEEHARQAVRAMRYPPDGIRGVAAMTRPALFGSEYQEYRSHAADLLLTVLQVELQAAVEGVEAIAAVPGVHVLFIGPLDLTTGLGVPNELESDVAQAALRRIERAARANHKAMGILLPSVDAVPKYRDLGYQFIGVGSDGAFLKNTAFSVAAAVRSGARTSETYAMK